MEISCDEPKHNGNFIAPKIKCVLQIKYYANTKKLRNGKTNTHTYTCMHKLKKDE